MGLAATKAVTTKVYCESDEAARNVLQARINQCLLPEGPVKLGIITLESAAFANIEFATAGFPCPGIAISGGRKKGSLASEARFLHI